MEILITYLCPDSYGVAALYSRLARSDHIPRGVLPGAIDCPFCCQRRMKLSLDSPLFKFYIPFCFDSDCLVVVFASSFCPHFPIWRRFHSSFFGPPPCRPRYRASVVAAALPNAKACRHCHCHVLPFQFRFPIPDSTPIATTTTLGLNNRSAFRFYRFLSS